MDTSIAKEVLHPYLMGRMMTHAIEFRLLDSYLDKLKGEYSERHELVCNLLKEEPRIAILPQDTPVKRQGGYFIWVQFPTGINGDEFLSYCRKILVSSLCLGISVITLRQLKCTLKRRENQFSPAHGFAMQI